MLYMKHFTPENISTLHVCYMFHNTTVAPERNNTQHNISMIFSNWKLYSTETKVKYLNNVENEKQN